jgi:hypothetical protein
LGSSTNHRETISKISVHRLTVDRRFLLKFSLKL